LGRKSKGTTSAGPQEAQIGPPPNFCFLNLVTHALAQGFLCQLVGYKGYFIG